MAAVRTSSVPFTLHAIERQIVVSSESSINLKLSVSGEGAPLLRGASGLARRHYETSRWLR